MTTLTSKGSYVLDAKLSGRSKADGYMPSHTTCVQASANRFLVVFGVRGFAGIDDERDVVYQLRTDAPDGRVIKQDFLARNVEDWDPFNTGQTCLKILGTPTLFGVPKNAMQQGKVPSHHNLFVIKWYTYGKVVEGDRVLIDEDLMSKTMHIEWLQCRLNDSEDDIEIIEPAAAMRQKHFGMDKPGAGLCAKFCEQSDAAFMNHAMVAPVPYSEAADQWVEIDHFNGGSLASVRYAYNAARHRYEWVQTGPLLEGKHTEACVCRVPETGSDGAGNDGGKADAPVEYLISARTFTNGAQTAWWRTADLFGPWAAGHYSEPATWGPRTLFTCGDDVVRIFSGSLAQSPYGEKRNPLYCWDVNTDDFSLSNRRVVFDFYERGLYSRGDKRLENSQGPMAGFVKLCPHQGNKQLLTHRVTKAGGQADYSKGGDVEERAHFGSYVSEFTFEKKSRQTWAFA